jgi:hypothetical protein
MAKSPEYRRIVLGLSYSGLGHAMPMAAELARLLRLDLFGLFVEEESLFGLASMPFVREFRSMGGGWRAFDVDQLTHDLSIAAKSAERAFTEAAKTVPTTARFEVVRGSMAAAIASVSHAGDIVLLAEPASPAETASAQYLAIADAAMRSQAAVLFVPGHFARQPGTVVAILTDPDDPSVEVAINVATAAKEDLTVIETFRSVEEKPRYEAHLAPGMKYRRLTVLDEPAKIAARLTSILHQERERLLVMSCRDVAIRSLVELARRVPVLVVGRMQGDADNYKPR